MMDSQFSEFTPDITPIMLAAHTNNYEIIKLLVQRKVMTLQHKNHRVTVQVDQLKNVTVYIRKFNAERFLYMPTV